MFMCFVSHPGVTFFCKWVTVLSRWRVCWKNLSCCFGLSRPTSCCDIPVTEQAGLYWKGLLCILQATLTGLVDVCLTGRKADMALRSATVILPLDLQISRADVQDNVGTAQLQCIYAPKASDHPGRLLDSGPSLLVGPKHKGRLVPEGSWCSLAKS